jgi:hypothetical protein
MTDDPRRDAIAQAIGQWYVSAPTLMTPRMRAEELADVVLAALDAADPSWRSTAAYRHAVAECINDLANFAHTYTDPAVHQALRRARDLLRARRDGTPPPGLTDVPVDGEAGL